MKVIAHRGLRSRIPENTLPAIQGALTVPAIHGVEFDVELCADDSLVVLHQETVVPDDTFTSTVPAVRDYVSRDWVGACDSTIVTSLCAGRWMGPQFESVRVPRLEAILALRWDKVTAYVELKDPTYWSTRDRGRPPRVVSAALPALRSFQGSLSGISFNPEILRLLSAGNPKLPLVLALWTEWRGLAGESIAAAIGCGAGAISVSHPMIVEAPDWVRIAHDHGLEVHSYPVAPTVGEPDFENWTAAGHRPVWEKLLTLGVDAVLTDFAEECIDFLGAASAETTPEPGA